MKIKIIVKKKFFTINDIKILNKYVNLFNTSLYSSTFEMTFMIDLNFKNKYNYKINLINNKRYIFDPLRKKNVLLTAEEWVRQNIISFLHKDLKVPVSHIAVEKGFKVKGLSKRFDIVVFDKKGNIIILIECKSPKIKLNQKSIDQLVIYNLSNVSFNVV